MKKLLVLLILSSLPLVAQADFVDDCQTASVQGDIGFRINQYVGARSNLNAAKKPFKALCECIDETPKTDRLEQVYLAYIQYHGQIDAPGVEVRKAFNVITSCEQKTDEQRKNTYAKRFENQFDKCIHDQYLLYGTYYSVQAQQKSWEEIKWSRAHDGNFQPAQQDELSQEARDMTIRALNSCG